MTDPNSILQAVIFLASSVLFFGLMMWTPWIKSMLDELLLKTVLLILEMVVQFWFWKGVPSGGISAWGSVDFFKKIRSQMIRFVND